jgi:adenylate cyclase
MKIRAKIVWVVVPILIVSIVLVGASSFFLAQSGINRLARDFLGFKVTELEKYAVSQYQLLVENDLQGSREYIQATKGSIEVYASSVIRSDTELIFAVDQSGQIQMSTGDLQISDADRQRLTEVYGDEDSAIFDIQVGGVPRVARGFVFEPFDWYVLVTESRATFFQDINQITTRTLYLLAASIVLATIILFSVTTRLIRPLNTVVDSMKEIISTNDLSKKVAVEYADETGTLAHTFNILTRALEQAYTAVKSQALKEAVAKLREEKTRRVFQKYVPQELIDQFISNPTGMLQGKKKKAAVLFSDIRGFTSISQETRPEILVPRLNGYFNSALPSIMENDGIVDKYIGDAIMAIFGAMRDEQTATGEHEDCYNSVRAALGMIREIDQYNEILIEKGIKPFRTGIGIHFGDVIVGNIGSEQKMDYTSIGDAVNVASRIEGQTKYYGEKLLITENIQYRLKNKFKTRLLDKIQPKGKEEDKKGVRIYAVRNSVDANTEKAWKLHHEAISMYYERQFKQAIEAFREVDAMLGDDFIANEFIERAQKYLKDPPPEDWEGVVIKTEK